MFKPLLKAPSLQPRNALRLGRSIKETFKADADAVAQLLVNFNPVLRDHFYDAWANADIETETAQLQSVYVLRLSAPLFGYNAPSRMGLIKNESDSANEISKVKVEYVSTVLAQDWSSESECNRELFLDHSYDSVIAGGYVLTENHLTNETTDRHLLTINNAQNQPRTAYSLSGRTTHLLFSKPWRDKSVTNKIDFIRNTLVRTQSEKIQLAQQPIENDIGFQQDKKNVSSENSDEFDNVNIKNNPDDLGANKIELAELYPGLQAGRWLIITGERNDIPGTSGIIQSELAMLANVVQRFDKNLPGDKTLSTITLAENLAYSYKRGTVKIYANVVKATNGETRSETLGAGDASKSLQAFTLKQPPLTYVAASNPSGIESTLKVYVNDVEWHEADSLVGLASTARKFTTKTDDEGKTIIVFGNGKEGARLPTGLENIKARYRNGIGKPATLM